MGLNNHKIRLNQLKSEPFIEIFKLNEAEESIFDNYQRYDFYQLLWFTRVNGNKTYFIDFREYPISENQIVLLFPGQIDRLDIEGKEGYLFAIHNEVFFRIGQYINTDYLNNYFSNTFIKPDVSTTQALQEITQLLLAEYESANRLKLMETYMGAFLFHISALYETSEAFTYRSDSQITEIMGLIEQHFITERETDFYAEKLGMTCKKINEVVTRGTGKTVKQHLQERLILEIKKEIRLQEKSLKEIAFFLGFNEAAYFTRFFKQQTGVTPTEFKQGRE